MHIIFRLLHEVKNLWKLYAVVVHLFIYLFLFFIFFFYLFFFFIDIIWYNFFKMHGKRDDYVNMILAW